MRVGLSGGIGSGKSTATALLASYGVDVVDADTIAREVVMPGEDALHAIVTYFGAKALKDDGQLNRAWLRQQIFTHPKHKHWLEALLHPIIRQRIITQMQDSTTAYCVLASPLLLATSQYKLVDYVVIIRTTQDLQLQRACRRDHADSQMIQQIMNAQMDADQQCACADYVVENNTDLKAFSDKIQALHQQILRLCA